MSGNLGVLDLRRNNLSGTIPVRFPQECSLETLDLSGNHLEGKLPKGFANCRKLVLLNLSKNRINDTFPCWLKNMTNLRILVLGSNNFQGEITYHRDNYSWPNLQIMDLSSNKFSGVLLPQLFSSFKVIMNDKDLKVAVHLYFQKSQFDNVYYQDIVSVNAKGKKREWAKILPTVTSIDLSYNSFHGIIPVTVGDLRSVKFLDFSHNALTGPIPTSIGNLTQLESLDLSSNKLSGHIPTELASLTFISFLNLSYNELDGRIPKGTQFDTFEDSFRGNKGLCGSPLNNSCNHAEVPVLPPPTSTLNEDYGFYISVALGFVFGLTILFGLLVLFKRWRTWYNKHADHVVSRIDNKQDLGRRNPRTTRAQRQFRDLIDSEDEDGWTGTNKKVRRGKLGVSKKKVVI